MNKIEKIYKDKMTSKNLYVIIDTNGNVHIMNDHYGIFNYCDNFEMYTGSYCEIKTMVKSINAILHTIETESDDWEITADFTVGECREEEKNIIISSGYANIDKDKNKYELVYKRGK